MSNLRVDLPDHLIQFVDQGTKHGGFADHGEFIIALVAAASAKQSGTEKALMAGTASGPAEPWTDEEWQSMRQRVTAKSTG